MHHGLNYVASELWSDDQPRRRSTLIAHAAPRESSAKDDRDQQQHNYKLHARHIYPS